MAKILLVLGVLVSLSTQAQVLGELQGEGQIQAAYSRFDGSKDLRTSPCHVAMNIRSDAAKFSLEFSFFECPKLSIWNDSSYAYQIVGGRLIDAKGIQKGSVLQDGSIQFTEQSVVSQQYVDYDYDFNCRMLSMSNKTLKLVTATTYTFKQTAGNTWQVRRQSSEDRLAWTSKRSYPLCPATTIPTKLGSTSDLIVVLK